MDNLDLVEAARGGPLTIRHAGQTWVAPDPAALPYQQVLLTLAAGRLRCAPAGMAEWKQDLLFERWVAHHGLPNLQSAQRLAYLIDNYRSAIVSDLVVYCNGADLGKLWRERKWLLLLDLIDHLPGHSWYASSVNDDEEHAKMLAESLAERESDGDTEAAAPALTTWTPEVAAITRVLDAVNQLTYVLTVVNTSKGPQPKPPKPAPRPRSPLEKALDSAKRAKRQAKHESIVSRMLPHKAASNR